MIAPQRKNPKTEAIQLTKLWQQYGPNTYPLDIDCLVHEAIMKSSFSSSLDVRKKQFDSFEGSLVRTTGTEKWTILLNNNINNRHRQRFTYAHELGHFMCHRYLKNKFEDGDDFLENFQLDLEKEANLFASWLLIPANLIREEFSQVQWGIDTLKRISSRFECSMQASAIRYMCLTEQPLAFIVSRDGLINWAWKSKNAPYINSIMCGDELPNNSHAISVDSSMKYDGEIVNVGFAWNDHKNAKESQYFDRSGNGYQYTFLEFD